MFYNLKRSIHQYVVTVSHGSLFIYFFSTFGVEQQLPKIRAPFHISTDSEIWDFDLHCLTSVKVNHTDFTMSKFTCVWFVTCP